VGARIAMADAEPVMATSAATVAVSIRALTSAYF
jgi:hypothetical protein